MPLRDSLITAACRLLSALFRLASRSPGPKRPPRSLLVIKPCCLGDVLLATPALAALRAAFPAARLVLAVGPWARPAVSDNPHLSRLLDCGPVGSGGYGLRDYLRLVQRIRQGRYDWCFVLDRSPLITLLPYLAGVPHRVGLDSQGRGFSLTVKVPCPPNRHEAELYLDAVRALGVEPAHRGLEFYPSGEDRGYVACLLQNIPGPRVVIHPGGGSNPGATMPHKRWPADRYGSLARRLVQRGVRVVLVGAPSDQAVVAQVKRAAGEGLEGLYDLAGRLTLGQLAALCEGADLFIGNDSGPLHLACAMGTPVVGLFGPTDPRRYGPYTTHGAALWAGPRCPSAAQAGRLRPCADPACTAEPQCLADLSLEEVWTAVERPLAAQAQRQRL